MRLRDADVARPGVERAGRIPGERQVQRDDQRRGVGQIFGEVDPVKMDHVDRVGRERAVDRGADREMDRGAGARIDHPRHRRNFEQGAANPRARARDHQRKVPAPDQRGVERSQDLLGATDGIYRDRREWIGDLQDGQSARRSGRAREALHGEEGMRGCSPRRPARAPLRPRSGSGRVAKAGAADRIAGLAVLARRARGAEAQPAQSPEEAAVALDLTAERGTPLSQQRFTWRDLAGGPPISKLDDDAFTRVRVILMNGIESEALRFKHIATA